MRNKAGENRSRFVFISPLISMMCDVVMGLIPCLGVAAATIHPIIVLNLARAMLCNLNCREIEKTDKADTIRGYMSRCCIPVVFLIS